MLSHRVQRKGGQAPNPSQVTLDYAAAVGLAPCAAKPRGAGVHTPVPICAHYLCHLDGKTLDLGSFDEIIGKVICFSYAGKGGVFEPTKLMVHPETR